MTENFDLFIGGERVSSASQERFDSINPYTGQAWASIPQASEAQVADAVAAARAAFPAWSRSTGKTRAEMLHRLADLLDAEAERFGLMESTDNGKVIRETKGQMGFSARQYRFFAGYADKLWGQTIPLDDPDVFDYTTRVPVGVVVLVTAWNSPMALLSNKLAPALAAGNTVVIKPSEHASATTLAFADLIERAGFPPGVVNIVTGDARTGRALLGSGRIDHLSFTGSPEVGRKIAAAASAELVPVTLELGGKSPNIVFADANLDKAVVGALAGIFGATGQTCIAGSRLLVQRPVYDDVVTRLAERARGIRLGDPTDPATEMGTTANRPQYDRILGAIAAAQDEGATLAAGGSPARGAGLGDGLFIEPTIFRDVHNGMGLAQEEIFGPVLAVLPFDTEEEALEIANGTRYGLASGVWTQDISRAFRMTRSLEAGVVWVNTYRASAVQAPFGGFKDSGFGRERGEVALQEFTAVRNVMINFSEDERDPFAVRA